VRRSLPLFLAIVVCLAIWQVLLTWPLPSRRQSRRYPIPERWGV
jgi:hypothetical protein